jgi:signal transduction histidine kinase/CheY-like chemotaxis protein
MYFLRLERRNLPFGVTPFRWYLGACLAACLLLARLAAASPVLVLTDHFERVNLGEYLEYLEDPHQNLTLGAIQSPALRDHFAPLGSGQFNPGYSRSSWWLRITLQNPGALRQLALTINQASIGNLTLYLPDGNGGYLTREAGTLSQQVTADVPLSSYWFMLDIPAGGSQVYYLRMHSDMWLSPALWMGTPAAMATADNQSTMWFGIGVGILAGLLAYNLFLLRQTRSDRTGLYGTLFLLSAIAYMLSERGVLGVQFLRTTGLQNMLCAWGMQLMSMTGVLFAGAFLQVSGKTRWSLHGLIAATLVCFGVSTLGSAYIGDQMTALLSTVTALSILVIGIQRFRAGFATAGYFLAATAVLATTSVVCDLLLYGLFSLDWGINQILMLAIIIASLILAVGLTRRLSLQQADTLRDVERQAVTTAESHLRDSFLAQVSHEVRTPMSGILGMTELLLDTPLTPGQREYANTIQASCNSLLRILNDIMDFSRMESGKLSVVEETFDLNELLHDCLDLFKAQAEEKHLELVANVDVQVNPLLIGDPTRLRQVISNLLRNAIKYTQQGEIVINIEPATAPEKGTDGQRIRVEIIDTGLGIAPSLLPGLFDQHVAGSRPAVNAGVGLSICRQLVELMGGSIGVSSVERQGSTFWFELPLKPQQAEAPRDLATEARLKGLRLLVVDDNHTVNRVIQQQASSWGMQVTTVDNGAEGLAQARNAANLGEPFDIIIVDHNMPGMSGLQLAARIKEDSLIRRDVLVIMLTGINIAPTSTMARNVGIRRVLTKPVTERQLKTAIAEELGHIERMRNEVRPPEDTDSASLKQLRVLIAEDNHLSQKVIRGMLGKLGVAATVVANGKEVVEEVSRNNYDMVLMDCDMPFMDGYIATQSIREWERTTGRRHIPILALTAHTLDEHKDKSRLAGMDEHLSKPIEMVELQDALLRWSRRKAS